MNDLEQKIDRLQQDMDYVKTMIEDLTMSLSSGKDNKAEIVAQMETIRKLFLGIPGINPEVMKNLNSIFDRVGNMQ